MFKRKKKEEDEESAGLVERVKADEAAKRRRITLTGGRAYISLHHEATERTYVRPAYESYSIGGIGCYTDLPVRTFKGSLAEAREHAAELNTAIEEALRLEGAVASLYPGK